LPRGYLDSRIKVLKNEKDMGLGLLRNRAIEAANGQWIAFLDTDGIWKVYRLEAHLVEVEGQSGAFVAALVALCFDRDGQLIPWRIVSVPKLLKGRDNNIVNLEEYLESVAPHRLTVSSMQYSIKIGILFSEVPVPAYVATDGPVLLSSCIFPSVLESASCRGTTLVTLFRSTLALSFSKLLGSGSKHRPFLEF